MRRHVIILVTGRVQGVFFRGTAKGEADRLGIAGYARNEPDGSVRIEAEGDGDALDRFVSWCGRGPDFADVKAVTVHDGGGAHFSGFTIE
ncbi:MAG: hypothetical protein RL272_666 [Candidatus Parcubacteria bacterium]|jgi:acylphosphatase